MSIKVIGTGVGRTGTYSLKLALQELGLGPCYHMEEVILNLKRHLPLWQDAVAEEPDWKAIYEGYESAVDWPTATYFRELYEAYPDAKFVLTVRSPESWAASFGETINALLKNKADAPRPMLEWLEMSESVIEQAGFPTNLDSGQRAQAFIAHIESVKATIPEEQLLIFDVKDGWQPLCEFLGLEAPETPFPKSNNRDEFWEKVKGAN